MPPLARFVTAPLAVEVRRAALAELAKLLPDQRLSTSGRVAIAVGSTYGPIVQHTFEHDLVDADWFTVQGGTINTAIKLVEQIRKHRYDAVVGIGGGTVLDVTKFAAARLGLPMVAVATNLAHDGIGSPISTLDNDAGRGSYGVPAPIAVLVDLDLVAQVSSATNRVPPTIVTQPQSQTVFAGGNVTFSVVATGTPPLIYRWRHDGHRCGDHQRLPRSVQCSDQPSRVL